MHPDLEAAIKERIALGHSRETITDELRAAGYDDETVELVYAAVASQTVSVIPVAGSLPTVWSLLGHGYRLAVQLRVLFGWAFVWFASATILFGLLVYLIALISVSGSLLVAQAVVLLLVGIGYLAGLVVIMSALLRGVLERAAGTTYLDQLRTSTTEFWSIFYPLLLSQLSIANALFIMFGFGLFAYYTWLSGFDTFAAGYEYLLYSIEGRDALAFLSLGYLFTTLGVLYLSTLMGWSLFVRLANRARGKACLYESMKLVRGRVGGVFWRVLSCTVLLLMLVFVVDSVASGIGLNRAVVDMLLLLVQLLAAPVLLCTVVLLFEYLSASITDAAVPVARGRQLIVSVSLWLGAVAFVFYMVVAGFIDEGLSEVDLSSLTPPTELTDIDSESPVLDTTVTPEEQAAADAFIEEHQDEFESF